MAPIAARATVTGAPICNACCSACFKTASLRAGALTASRVDLNRVASRTYAALLKTGECQHHDETNTLEDHRYEYLGPLL